MAKSSHSSLLFFFSSILVSFFALSVSQENFMLDNCPNNNGNYTSNSAFGTNLNSVLSSISSNKLVRFWDGSILHCCVFRMILQLGQPCQKLFSCLGAKQLTFPHHQQLHILLVGWPPCPINPQLLEPEQEISHLIKLIQLVLQYSENTN